MTLPTTALTNTLSKTRMHTSTALSATSPLTTCCNAAPQPVSPPLCGPSTELLYTKCPSFCTPFARPSPALLPVFLPSQGCGRRHTKLRHLSPSNTRRFVHPERACKQLRGFGCKRGRQSGCICPVGSKAVGQLWRRAALVCGVVEAARQVDIRLFCAFMLHQLSLFSFLAVE